MSEETRVSGIGEKKIITDINKPESKRKLNHRLQSSVSLHSFGWHIFLLGLVNLVLAIKQYESVEGRGRGTLSIFVFDYLYSLRRFINSGRSF